MNKKIHRINSKLRGFRVFGKTIDFWCKEYNQQMVNYEYTKVFQFKKYIGFLEALMIISGREDYLVQRFARYPKNAIHLFGRSVRVYNGERDHLGLRTDFCI